MLRCVCVICCSEIKIHIFTNPHQQYILDISLSPALRVRDRADPEKIPSGGFGLTSSSQHIAYQ